MCYWSDETAAQQDYKMRSRQPLLLMRLDKASVDQALPGWTFDVDDLAGSGAVMYFTQCESDRQDRLSPAGVPMAAFEVWNPLKAVWIAAASEPQLQSEAQRMATIGAAAVQFRGLIGSQLAYWKTYHLKKKVGLMFRHHAGGPTYLMNVEEELERMVRHIAGTTLPNTPLTDIEVCVAVGTDNFTYKFFEEKPELRTGFTAPIFNWIDKQYPKPSVYTFCQIASYAHADLRALIEQVGFEFEEY
jgi:hypothetical protein